ncbi:MAG: NAD(P)/FAD-dependent oxidoreductase [Chloroflexi bacterium]|nr:MAG: NAD(P)/FAD-dependent oxidoreductase [Chloroflexota bacterium]
MRHPDVVVVGTGFSGIGAAIRLKQQGFDDFVVLERAHDVGGTWRDNTYPGCTCDVPSHLYSFSFEPNPRWSHSFSRQGEIWEYLRTCARRHGVMPHIRFGHELVSAAWDDELDRWRIETTGGHFTARVLVTGVGALSEPSVPSIPGIETFRGTVFHSASWNHDHDLAGERVAVIGTGASAIQFVPEIQPRVGRLLLFQRTPPWVVPRRDRRLRAFEQRLYRVAPAVQRLARLGIYWGREAMFVGFGIDTRLQRGPERMARRHLRRQVPDRTLRKKLTPDYTIGCKRILLSNDYYPALAQPNVEVITDRIQEVREHSIVTADSVEHEIDTIIFGTGFHVTDMPAAKRLRGRGGVLLADAWRDGMGAYRGTTIAGFPNLFMLVGPNTGLAHTSLVFMIECQIAYVMDCLRYMRRSRVATVEVKPEVQARYCDDVHARMQRTVWVTGGCVSWYLDAAGRNTTLWPNFTWRFRQLTRRFDPQSYLVNAGARDREAVAA